MEPVFELAISLPPKGSRARLRALHGQLRSAIIDGRLQPGVRLPPTRELAAAYGVSRNTAVATYDLLLSEGYLSTRRGSGTYVAQSLPHRPQRKSPTARRVADTRLSPMWRDAPVPGATASVAVPRYDFRLGVPDRDSFPFDLWRRLCARALRSLAKAPIGSEEPQGRSALRAGIAQHVSFARAVACRPEDVVVTSGAQQAFDLLARILVTPGKTTVAVESPGYGPLRVPFVAAGARIAPVPVDEQGIRVERIPAEARVVCVTPSHQFPLGSVMSMERRVALLEFARRHGAVVIEDDYDCEFRFGGRPLDALQTLDRAESVFYVGTFSKTLFPSIRLGFTVTPAWATGALTAVKQCADRYCSVATQDTLSAFIAEGHLVRHVRRMRRIYAQRREALLEGIQRELGQWLQPVPSAAGLHLAALADRTIDVDALVERALRNDIGVYSLRPYYDGRPVRAGLVFGYGATQVQAIREGLTALRRLLRDPGA